ncbi:putative cysteine-rich receptor-like protein kinase 16 [Brassica rapa]|uniref:putative cysteine-rich receptor-like protein kinase 16 n=1 Tax=Brassica campestris TaxID=3711 RepID=UPI00142E5695|nr:putative cysteine-rich receptor-like protein kinase 16 [Brassica rapa]
MVRYSNRSFFGSLDMEPVIQSLEAEPVIQVTLSDFDNAWEALMRRVIAEATSSSSGSNTMYYGADRQQLGTSRSIYGFVQCSKDISPSKCEQCLRKNVDDYRSCCSGRQRGITERPSCFMRWDLDPFFGLFEDNIAPAPTPPPEKGDRKIPIGVVVGITGVLTFVISMLLSLGVALCIRRKAHQENGNESEFFIIWHKDIIVEMISTLVYKDLSLCLSMAGLEHRRGNRPLSALSENFSCILSINSFLHE